jgi:hypothetical protein
VSVLSRRAILAAVTVIGLALLGVGGWFTHHLGSSGSATFRAEPGTRVVVLEPSVLNRVDDPLTITATAGSGGTVWMGRTTPSDAAAIVGGARHTAITGAHIRSWTLDESRKGTGAPVGSLAAADVWRQAVTGKGSATVEIDQGDAPESLIVTTQDGTGSIQSVSLTVERRTWLFQSLLAALVGLLAAVGGGAGLVASWRRGSGTDAEQPADQTTTEVTA